MIKYILFVVMGMQKPFYKSKTIWASIIIALAVAYKIITTGSVGYNDIVSIATALGLAGIRTALK